MLIGEDVIKEWEKKKAKLTQRKRTKFLRFCSFRTKVLWGKCKRSGNSQNSLMLVCHAKVFSWYLFEELNYDWVNKKPPTSIFFPIVVPGKWLIITLPLTKNIQQ